MPEQVLIERNESVLTMTLARPGAGNTITTQSNAELTAVTSTLHEDDSVRCVVVRAAGEDFCLGADIEETLPVLEAGDRSQRDLMLRGGYAWVADLMTLPKPIITVAQGRVAGAGVTVAALGDFRLAASTTRYFPSFAGLGLIGDMGLMSILPGLVGQQRTLEFLTLHDALDAETARSWGLATDVILPSDLADTAARLADRLRRQSPTMWRGLKSTLRPRTTVELWRDLDREISAQLDCFESEEFAQSLAQLRHRMAKRSAG